MCDRGVLLLGRRHSEWAGVQSLSGAQLLACKEERAASGKAHVTVVGGDGFSVTIGLADARLTSLQGKPEALQHQRRRRCNACTTAKA